MMRDKRRYYKKLCMYGQEREKRRIVKEGSSSKDSFHHLIDEDNVGTHKPSVSEVIRDSMLFSSFGYYSDSLDCKCKF